MHWFLNDVRLWSLLPAVFFICTCPFVQSQRHHGRSFESHSASSYGAHSDDLLEELAYDQSHISSPSTHRIQSRSGSSSNDNRSPQSLDPEPERSSVPFVKLHHTSLDGKLTPTLTITFPKKRKVHGQSRRFPLLKALVSSFITSDRRTVHPDENKRKSSTLKNVQLISLGSNRAEKANLNYPAHRSHLDESIAQTSNMVNSASSAVGPYTGSASSIASTYPGTQSYRVKLPYGSSQPKKLVFSGSNFPTSTSNNAPRFVTASQSANKEDNHVDADTDAFAVKTHDTTTSVQDEEEEEEEEFNEHSDVPRPANYDEKQYYVEANRIKYPGRPGSGRDFEHMTSEVIEHEENEYASDKRPSISVRSRGSFLISVLSKMMRSVNFTMITEDMRLGSSSRASCLACHALAALYLSPFYSKEAMVSAARSVCISFRLQPARVCTGLIDSFKDDLDYIRTHTKLNRREMCGVLFGLKCSRISSSNLNWSIAIPRKPNAVERRTKHTSLNNREAAASNVYSSISFNRTSSPSSSSSSGQLAQQASSSQSSQAASTPISSFAYKSNVQGPLLDIVQITDIHVDPYYVPGSNADCGEPLCCRHSHGPAKSPSKAAGIWGDYRNCDTPVNTLRNTLKQISDNHPNAEYWMWTGDISPHDIWNITKDEIIYQIQLVSGLMKEYAKVAVFPVIGNHEGVPVNSFPPPEVKGKLSVAWLYNEVASQWAYWLPEDALKTLRYGGYYMVRARPGLRVVCINTNYCTRLNPWTLLDPVDPGEQLHWLSKQLHAAELAGDKVHILGHIPPDNRECTQAWLHNFLRIMDRFEHTVLAQYYGHTHRDEFRILYSPYSAQLKPISVAYIGPSVTPFTENNPGYRVYQMDNQGYIQDHNTYFFNLTEANLNPTHVPHWKHEYAAKQAYPLKNLGPEGWHQLVYRMLEDDRLLHGYYQRYYRESETRANTVCKDKCKHALINDIMVAHPLRTKPRRLFGSRKH